MLDWLDSFASVPDLLRLVAVPVLGWAAYRDLETRRVPNRTWLPLALLGAALLAWEGWQVWTGRFPAGQEQYFLRVALSLGLVAPVGYLFYWFGGFGGADAKALIVLGLLFPTFPTYLVPGEAFPLTRTTLNVFSLTILTNTVIVGVLYPVAVTLRNAVSGHLAPIMFIGKPVRVADVPETYGSLLQSPEGFTRRGLDLDALRMYLQWRDLTLAEVLADPDRYRDPATLPDDPNPPGDGSVATSAGAATPATDGGRPVDEPDSAAVDDTGPVDDSDAATAEDADEVEASDAATVDDPWGAEAFLEDIEGSAYGTSPEKLRDGLDVLVAEDVVWVSPGMPFIVPMFVGLLVSLVYGDLLVAVIAALV